MSMESSRHTHDGGSSHLGSIHPKRSSKGGSSTIAKVIKEATNLYLTRSLLEAYQLFEPLLLPQQIERQAQEDAEAPPSSILARASPKDKLKAWRLYVALLDAIVDLGPEEGKKQFGNQQWRSINARVRETSLWEEIVRIGYQGIEGSVDDVLVAELATLFLKHATSQEKNQVHLESYLSSVDSFRSINDLGSSSHEENGFPAQQNHGSGTNTPQRLSHRVQILELYALEVLPRNGEWDYAREFITLSDVLDDDTREVFLQALQDLQGPKTTNREEAGTSHREEQLRPERAGGETRLAEGRHGEEHEVKSSPEQNAHQGTTGEKDYGIDDPMEKMMPLTANGTQPPTQQPPSRNTRRPTAKEAPTSKRKKPASHGVIWQSSALMASLQNHLVTFARSTSKNPMIMLRLVLFWIAFILALSRRDVRSRAANALMTSWTKVRATIGMGVKVSYV